MDSYVRIDLGEAYPILKLRIYTRFDRDEFSGSDIVIGEQMCADGV